MLRHESEELRGTGRLSIVKSNFEVCGKISNGYVPQSFLTNRKDFCQLGHPLSWQSGQRPIPGSREERIPAALGL
jgi:hypothetical protein